VERSRTVAMVFSLLAFFFFFFSIVFALFHDFFSATIGVLAGAGFVLLALMVLRGEKRESGKIPVIARATVSGE